MLVPIDPFGWGREGRCVLGSLYSRQLAAGLVCTTLVLWRGSDRQAYEHFCLESGGMGKDMMRTCAGVGDGVPAAGLECGAPFSSVSEAGDSGGRIEGVGQVSGTEGRLWKLAAVSLFGILIGAKEGEDEEVGEACAVGGGRVGGVAGVRGRAVPSCAPVADG